MTMKYAFFILCSMAVTVQVQAQKPSETHVRLCNWMVGSFSSAQQAEMDTAYYDIRLHMVPVFTDRMDACWIYVEQAFASSMDKPFRQSVYKVVDKGGRYERVVYEIEEPLRFAGAWKNDSLLQAIRFEMLTEREGCSIELRWDASAGTYRGGTANQTCPSTWSGAAYATSDVMVLPDRMVSWDREYDSKGIQVWGAEKGGYQFIKVND